MGQPFKGVMGRDPVDGMNYFRGSGNPHWLKTTAAILLEMGDGPVTQPQYVPPGSGCEGYHTERNEDGTIKTFQAYGNDVEQMRETLRRDFRELKDAVLVMGTDADLAKIMLDMPDDDLLRFLRQRGDDETYKGDLPELRERLKQAIA